MARTTQAAPPRVDNGRSSEGFVKLTGVSHSYGTSVHVLEELDLSITRSECICILGPSGCGKTTTLNIIAGFVSPTTGTLTVDGENMTATPTHRRGFGMVFQGHALFPHMTVFQNVAFGLRQKKEPRSSIEPAVTAALDAVGLAHAARKYPHALSGGEAQRIGLARALAVRPRILLLDEPLSNLDAKLRRHMQYEIRRIHDEFGLTSIYVTHDQEEALILGDRVLVLNGGRIEQFATPREVYERPASEFVATFVGERNLISGTVSHASPAMMTVRTELGIDLNVPINDQWAVGDPVRLAILEERVEVVSSPGGGPNEYAMRVDAVRYRGGRSLVQLAAPSGSLNAQIPSGAAEIATVGEDALVRLPPGSLVPLRAESGTV